MTSINILVMLSVLVVTGTILAPTVGAAEAGDATRTSYGVAQAPDAVHTASDLTEPGKDPTAIGRGTIVTRTWVIDWDWRSRSGTETAGLIGPRWRPVPGVVVTQATQLSIVGRGIGSG